MSSPSRFEPQDQNIQTQNPNFTQDGHNLSPHSQPQSPQSLTLEAPNPSNQDNPSQSTISSLKDQRQNQQNPQVLDQAEQEIREGTHTERQSGMSLSLTPPVVPQTGYLHVAVSDTPLTSPTNPHRRPNKRKKGKGNVRKQQAIEKKVQILIENLKPIPFAPSKILDFDKHEELLRRLGLWDFAHVAFDQKIRVDLIAQLVATYDPKLRSSYVNEFRIAVNRADLARAFRLPVKKEKGGGVVEGMDLDAEVSSEESIGFIDDFVSNWVLLHEDTWLMPTEVLNWTRAIKDGHPEKVDWAGLVWFMVEKELTQGEQLGDCYYASHLQYLIKSQREEVLREEPKAEEVEVKEEEDCEGGDGDGELKEMTRPNEFQGKEDLVMEELNVELTLGQDAGEKHECKEVEMMDVEECKEDDCPNWLLDGKSNVGEHFLQPCTLEVGRGFDNHEQRKLEDEEELEDEGGEGEEEAEDEFHIGPDDALFREGSTGNLLQAMETSQIAFSSQGQLLGQPSSEVLVSTAAKHVTFSGPSSLDHVGKRDIEHEHENDVSHCSLNGSSKRLKIDGLWDNKSSDFGICMEQMQHLMAKAKMMYDEKQQAAIINEQLLLNERHRRDSVFLQLQKREGEISQLERELFIMGNLLEGYRKALKATQKAFSEYRQRCPAPEEPLYKDAGPGGVMMSITELEKQRLKQEEIDRSNRLLLEQTANEAFEGYANECMKYYGEIDIVDQRLTGLENDVKLLKDKSAKRKASEKSVCPSDE